MNENDKYIIKEDYHGDVKLSKVNKSKKVDLSKPTDTLDHKVKQNIESLKVSSSNDKICLTKQKDISIHYNNDFPIMDYHKQDKLKKNLPETKSTMILNIIIDEFLSCNPIIWILLVGVIILGIVTLYHNNQNIFLSIAWMLFILIGVLISIFSYACPIFLISSIYFLVKSISCHNKNNIIKSIIATIISIVGCIWLFFLIFIN